MRGIVSLAGAAGLVATSAASAGSSGARILFQSLARGGGDTPSSCQGVRKGTSERQVVPRWCLPPQDVPEWRCRMSPVRRGRSLPQWPASMWLRTSGEAASADRPWPSSLCISGSTERHSLLRPPDIVRAHPDPRAESAAVGSLSRLFPLSGSGLGRAGNASSGAPRYPR
jgi:hypothetical protein